MRTGFGLMVTALLAGGPAPSSGPGPADLARVYPDFVRTADSDWVTMANGTRWAVSDGISGKSAADRLARPDIDDMFADRYRPFVAATPPASDEDPGRVRFQPLFQAMYGNCARGEVARRLRPVAWLPRHRGGTIMVTTVNGVADRLEDVIAELDRLPAPMIADLTPHAGSYACRNIAGTKTPSMHGFGAAIDISTTRADYWRWSRNGYRNRIPMAIVRIFERHGFIWGGRWAHFDTMHFEYRPELLPRSPALAN